MDKPKPPEPEPVQTPNRFQELVQNVTQHLFRNQNEVIKAKSPAIPGMTKEGIESKKPVIEDDAVPPPPPKKIRLSF